MNRKSFIGSCVNTENLIRWFNCDPPPQKDFLDENKRLKEIML